MRKNDALIRMESINDLMRTHDIQKMIDLARPLFGNPLILSNGSYTVKAISVEDSIQDPRWDEIVASKGVPMGAVTNTSINQCYRKSLETGRPVEDVNEAGVHMLRKVLTTGTNVLGYLDSPLYMRMPADEDIEFFDFLGNLIAVELQKTPETTCQPGNMLDYFVFDLLRGNLTDRDLIRERLEYFQWDLFVKGKVQLISIQGRERDLEPDNAHFRRLIQEFSALFPSFRTFAYVNQLKIICPVSENLQSDEAFLTLLQDILNREKLVAGFSRPLLFVETIAEFSRQSEKAAELGRKLHPDQMIYFYDTYALYYALELASETEELYQFCHSAITLLQDYDRAHETNLLESLRVYLTHNRSIGESAAALYIHRNTMNYRITRIHELTGIQMNDPDVFCHLLFSFYVLDCKAMLDEEQTIRKRQQV